MVCDVDEGGRVVVDEQQTIEDQQTTTTTAKVQFSIFFYISQTTPILCFFLNNLGIYKIYKVELRQKHY